MKYGLVLSCVMAVALATVAQAAAPVPILGPAGGVNAPMEDCTGCVGAPNDARDDVYYNTVDYGTVSWVQHPSAFLNGQDYGMTEGVLNDPSFDGNAGNVASPLGGNMAVGDSSHIWPVSGTTIAPMTMRYRASKPGDDYTNRVESVLQPNGGEWILSVHLGLDIVDGTSTINPNTSNTKLFEAGGPRGDLFAIKPLDGRTDNDSFFIEGCGSGGCADVGHITVADGSLNHYVVHHKANSGTLDFYINDVLVVADAAADNADGGIKNLQLGGGGNAYPHINLTVDNLVLGIPEPATMGLLALGSMLVLARRRR